MVDFVCKTPSFGIKLQNVSKYYLLCFGIPVFPKYLTSKCGKDESTDFLDYVSEDGGDHGFGYGSDDDAFEAGAIDKAAEDTNRLRLQSKVESEKIPHLVEYKNTTFVC